MRRPPHDREWLAPSSRFHMGIQCHLYDTEQDL